MDEVKLPKQLEELRDQKVWINYIMVRNESKHGGRGGYDKPPVNPLTLRDGSSTDSSRWTDFDTAAANIGKPATVFYTKTKERLTQEVAGVGIILEAASLCGVDFDDVIREKDGQKETSREARQIWEYLDSYTELSPSGTGVHVLLKADKPSGGICKIKSRFTDDDGVIVTEEDGSEAVTEYEMYSSGRYFTFTGKTLSGEDRGLESRQKELNDLYNFFNMRNEKAQAQRQRSSSVTASRRQTRSGRFSDDSTDDELWRKMFSSKNGATIKRLFDGDLSVCGGDHSACDLALCDHLAYWTDCDTDRMDRMFRQSALVREKWTRDYIIPKYGLTYSEWTIETAISGKSTYHK